MGIASVAGFRGLPGATAYSASKAAAISYLEGLRVELRGSGVRVDDDLPGLHRHAHDGEAIPIRMPFIIAADDAARRFARVIDARKSYAVIPWQMAIVGAAPAACCPTRSSTAAGRAWRKPRKPRRA